MKTIQTSWPDPKTAQPDPSGNGGDGGKVMEPIRNISSRPSGSPATGGGVERPVTLWGVLDAFRRRWIPALAVAIPAALLVAGLLWQSIPAEFESSALIRVNQFEGRLVDNNGKQQTDLKTFRDSQINFIKSLPVLDAALNENGIMDTQLLKGNPYPNVFLQEQLDVEADLSDEFIRITLAGEFPEDLQRVVNAVKDVYMRKVVYNEKQTKVDELEKVKTLLAEEDSTVKANQSRIDRLAKELGTPSDPKMAAKQMELKQNKVGLLYQQLDTLNQRVREADAMRKIAREAGLPLDTIPGNQIGGSAPSSTVPSQATSQIAIMRRAILITDQKIAAYKQNVRDPNHPELLRLQNSKTQLEQQLKAASAGSLTGGSAGLSSYDILIKQKGELMKTIAEAESELAIMNQRLVDLTTETKAIAYLVEHRDVLQKQVYSRNTELEVPPRVTVVQDANLPEKRNIKARAQASFLGGFGTFFAIVAGFTMFEWFSHRVGSTSDIANAVNLRLVGTIPSPDKGGLLGLGVFAGKVDYDEWNRAVIESMDVVRTYLMRHIDPSRPASILVTSSSANEGKTTVSCQLAASLARAGKRVAIVDCDFRRPSAHIMMDGEEGPGISEYLRGDCSMESIYQETQAPGLTFIPAGKVDQVVLQSLSTDGGRSLINELKSRFDFVIIDTSPLLFVAEPSMLAQNADIVLLSTRKDYSRIPYVAQSRDSLRSLQVPLMGAVMVGSDSDFQRQSYGYRQRLQPVATRPLDNPSVPLTKSSQSPPVSPNVFPKNNLQPNPQPESTVASALDQAKDSVKDKLDDVADDYIKDNPAT
ncbi:MAG: AAA family ATPase [Fuerstiella sp.]